MLPRTAWAAPGAPLALPRAPTRARSSKRPPPGSSPGPTDDLLELGHPGAREAGVVRLHRRAAVGLRHRPAPDLRRRTVQRPPRRRRTTTSPTSSRSAPLQERLLASRGHRPAGARTRPASWPSMPAAGGDFAAADPLTQDLAAHRRRHGLPRRALRPRHRGLARPARSTAATPARWAGSRSASPATCARTATPPARSSGSDGLDLIDPTGVVAGLLAQLTAPRGGRLPGCLAGRSSSAAGPAGPRRRWCWPRRAGTSSILEKGANRFGDLSSPTPDTRLLQRRAQEHPRLRAARSPPSSPARSAPPPAEAEPARRRRGEPPPVGRRRRHRALGRQDAALLGHRLQEALAARARSPAPTSPTGRSPTTSSRRSTRRSSASSAWPATTGVMNAGPAGRHAPLDQARTRCRRARRSTARSATPTPPPSSAGTRTPSRWPSTPSRTTAGRRA